MTVLIRLLIVHFVVMDFCSFVTGLFVWARGASSVLVWGHEVASWSLVEAEARGWGFVGCRLARPVRLFSSGGMRWTRGLSGTWGASLGTFYFSFSRLY